MAIALKKIGVSAGVGVLDIVAEEVDKKQGYRKPFQNITDWGRFGYVAGGYMANGMGYDAEATEAIVLGGVPLLEKSIWGFVKRYTGVGRMVGRMGLKLKTPGKDPPRTQGTRIKYV